MPFDKSDLDAYLRARRDHLDRANEMTREMITRSREALARSEDLLRHSVPVIWHPAPPKE